MTLDPNVLLRMLLAREQQQQRQQLVQREQEMRKKAKLLDHVRSFEKMTPELQRVIDQNFDQTTSTLIREDFKQRAQQQKQQQASAQLPGMVGQEQASRGAGLSRDQVLSQLRGIEGSAQTAGADPARILQSLDVAQKIAQRDQRAQAQQAAQSRRQEVASAGRADQVESLATTLASDPQSIGEVSTIIQRNFPQAAEQVANQVVARASALQQTGVGSTETERFLSFQPPAQRAAIRADILRQKASPTLTQRKGLSTTEIMERGEEASRAIGALNLGLQAENILTTDPGAAGFGEVLRRSVQGAGELVAGFNRVFGAGSFEQAQNQALSRLAGQEGQDAEELRGILTNPNADILDFTSTVLALAQESALRGSNRFSINLVRDLKKQLQGSFLRPPKITRDILRKTNKQVLNRERSRRRLLRRLDPFAARAIQEELPLPVRSQGEPDATFNPATGDLQDRGKGP